MGGVCVVVQMKASLRANKKKERAKKAAELKLQKAAEEERAKTQRLEALARAEAEAAAAIPATERYSEQHDEL
jgi:hypothetical protein